MRISSRKIPYVVSENHDVDENTPIYTSTEVAGFLRVHPETIRVWDRRGIIRPVMSKGRRLYSKIDLRRLEFILGMLEKGLNLVAIKEILRFYPCWWTQHCPACMQAETDATTCTKACWKVKGAHCSILNMPDDYCEKCEARYTILP